MDGPVAAPRCALKWQLSFHCNNNADQPNDHVDRAPANTASISKRTVGGFRSNILFVARQRLTYEYRLLGQAQVLANL